jgi:hypothetical protein
MEENKAPIRKLTKNPKITDLERAGLEPEDLMNLKGGKKPSWDLLIKLVNAMIIDGPMFKKEEMGIQDLKELFQSLGSITDFLG